MFENAKEALRARIAPTSSHLAELRGDLQNRLQHFKANRAPEEQDAMEKDFARVLQAWGIEDATHIPYVLAEDLLARGLKPVMGEVIDMAGFVRLVVEHGSPLRW